MACYLNDAERQALRGLPWIARMAYVFGIRPFMDFSNGIVGIARGISYQSIAEELYVEPHQGIKSRRPTEKELRHAIDWLERAGLVERSKAANRKDHKLVFRLPLADKDTSVRKKVGSKWAEEVGSQEPSGDAAFANKVGSTESAKVGIPPLSVEVSKDTSTSTRARGTRLPEDWSLPDDWRDWAEKERPDLDIGMVADMFKDHWLSTPGKAGRKSDWKATWRNWVRREKKQTQRGNGHETHRRSGKPKSLNEQFWESCEDGLEGTPWEHLRTGAHRH